MANKTNYLEGKLLDHVLRNTAFTSPTTVYVALFTTAPTDAYTSGVPTGTECSYAGYARKPATFGAASGTPRQVAISADVLFDAKTDAGSVSVLAFGLFDALTTGNLLYWNTITSTAVAQNQQPKFASGNLTVSED
jgi:hypothetical protein